MEANEYSVGWVAMGCKRNAKENAACKLICYRYRKNPKGVPRLGGRTNDSRSDKDVHPQSNTRISCCVLISLPCLLVL